MSAATAWITPAGTLEADGQGGFTALVRTSLKGDVIVKQTVDAIVDLAAAPFLRCGEAQRSELGYVLPWPADGTARHTLESLAPQWRLQPADHVAQAISAALCVSRAISELQHLAPLSFLLSPVQVLLETAADGRQHWSVLPLPLGPTEFKDMAAASPAVTVWLSGDDLLRRGGADRVYILAAVLYYALAGELYAPSLSPMERVQRQVAFRPGNAAHLRRVLETAVPDGLSLGRRRLGDFIVEALTPGFGRPMTAQQAVATLQRLQGELSAPLLAGAWEMAGKPERALRILEAYACSSAAGDVPWATIERLRGNVRTGNDPAPTKPLPMPPSRTSPASIIDQIRAVVEMGASGREPLAAMLTALIHPEAPALEESERLFVAYAFGRWLDALAAALPLASRPCTFSWNRAVRVLLLARLHTGQQAWAQVARDCRECVGVVEGMPGHGSARGSYAMAFASLQDAGAHIGFVAAGHSPDFLDAAWKKLVRARSLAQGLDSLPLQQAIGKQLVALRDCVAGVARLQQLRVDVDAACAEMVIVAANDDPMNAVAPWPDDRWLFYS